MTKDEEQALDKAFNYWIRCDKHKGESTMTRKHFIAIAKLMNEARPLRGTEAPVICHDDLCDRLARICETTNPNFDRDRFLTACGVE